MIVYRTARRLTLGLRAVAALLHAARFHTVQAAENTAGVAKAAAIAALDRQEDKAFNRLYKVKQQVADAIDAAEEREDKALNEYEDVCASVDDTKVAIMREVL